METTLRLKVSELDAELLNAIKKLYRGDREINLTISSATDFDLNKIETKQQYLDRLNKAVLNLNQGQSITYTDEELSDLVMNQLKR